MSAYAVNVRGDSRSQPVMIMQRDSSPVCERDVYYEDDTKFTTGSPEWAISYCRLRRASALMYVFTILHLHGPEFIIK